MISNSGNWSGPPDNSGLSDDEDSTNSSELDMNLSEFSIDSVEDVSKAIDACKKSVLETDESSEGRKELVGKLIKLRIRCYDLMERQERPIHGFETRGHVFINYRDTTIPGVTNTKKIFCQQCGGYIWVYLQSSQHCSECGFSVHTTCMDSIMRECVAQKVKSQPDFILEICPEKSLPSLKYRCVECDRKLSWSDPLREPRLCDYTGLSYCSGCHWNAMSFTPARVIHNWDFEQQPISQVAKQYLYLMYSKPVISIRKENPKLFAVVQELNQVHQYRNDIMLMKKYLVVCRIALEQKLLLQLADRQHFVDNAHYYSLRDLYDIKSGFLTQFLKKKLGILSDHIRSCVLCIAKGFICEICDKADTDCDRKSEVIFPFDDLATTCEECQGVFHRQCFKQVTECPRCQRKKLRKGNETEVHGNIDC